MTERQLNAFETIIAKSHSRANMGGTEASLRKSPLTPLLKGEWGDFMKLRAVVLSLELLPA
jgi:hypothetical protein